MIPDRLGHERHIRMKEPQDAIKNPKEHPARRRSTRCIAAADLNLGDLDVPVAELAPDELVEDSSGLAKLELLEERADRCDRPMVSAQDPAIGRSQRGRGWFYSRRLAGREDKARRVPELVGKVARSFKLLLRQSHIVAGSGAGHQGIP